MTEKSYKCAYRHCLRPDEKVPASEVVMVGNKRCHAECAELSLKITELKNFYFNNLDNKSDYVQVVGVINNFVLKKRYDCDFVLFLMKYIVVYCTKVKSPYLLYTVADNGIVDKKFKDEKMRKDVEQRYEYRQSKGSRG